MKLINLIINRAIVQSYHKKYDLFIESTKSVKDVQRRKLLEILRTNQKSEIGIKYDFGRIKSVNDFQKAFPITDYSFYEEYIRKHKEKKGSFLTTEQIRLFELSSGSTSASKLIPYTDGLKKEFLAGIEPWIYDLYTNNKELLYGKSYWSITPLTSGKKQTTRSGIPVGFEDDLAYLGTIQRILSRKIFVMPSEIRFIDNAEAFRYVTQLFLLEARELSFISIWNPSFITLLLSDLQENMPQLCDDIKTGTICKNMNIPSSLRRRLESYLKPNGKRSKEILKIHALVKDKVLLIKRLFPLLRVISCWTEANAQLSLGELRASFPHVKVQGKGLIATECFVSLPLSKYPYPALSVGSHFFEFMELDENYNLTNSVKLSHQLELDKNYAVIITTSGGFYRYNMNDIVCCKGYLNQAPLLSFMGKMDNVSDIFGEKLNETHVSQSLDNIFKRYNIKVEFVMLAPEKIKKEHFYVLFVQSKNKLLENIKVELEKELLNNFHYAYCRRLGQLKHVRVFQIKSRGNSSFLTESGKRGKKLGNIKNTYLNKEIGWSKVFNGAYL